MQHKNLYAVSIIGAGKVGTTLAMLLHRAGYRIVSVVSKKKSSARKLARLVGCKNMSDSLSDIHPATRIIVIAVPEEDILGIAEEIATHPHLDFSKLAVVHTSGSLTSDALLPLRREGALVFSLHPMQSFSKALTVIHQIARMKNVCYGFEGNKAAVPLARRLVKALRGTFVRIPKEEKFLYHIACVFASNYSAALLGVVDELAKHIGGGIRLSHFEPLVRTSIENVFQLTPNMALTGPIARGSSKTVEHHVLELRKIDTSLALLYQQIGLQALKMAVKKKSIRPKVAKQIRRILTSN
ncbi:MAG: DUF2520 domain-containing protein [Ignavibacteriales bacterium]|nr:DUF2520 domain-containing protein [Ignavibacteriales bacterium]